MTTAPLKNRRLAAFVVMAALFLSACWQREQRPAEDLTAAHDEVDQTIIRLNRIGETVDEEIADLRARSAAFFATEPRTWARPFPLDAFKHTAVSCLNAPYNQEEPEPNVTEVAAAFGITCAVPAALDLEARLQATSQARGIASSKLAEVDQIRNVRAKLQSRLRQLPSILRRTRAYLSARRAEARQMAKNVQQRQADYSRRTFQESLDRIAAYEARLAELDHAVAVIEESNARWSKELGSLVAALYKDLSRLGRQ